MAIVEKTVSGIAGYETKGLPVGKALLAVPFVGLTGKLNQKFLKYLLVQFFGAGRAATSARVSAVLGIGLSFLEAWAFQSRSVVKLMGPTGSNLLSFSALYGAFDSALTRPVLPSGNIDTDISDRISEPIAMQLTGIVSKIRGAVGLGSLGAYPDRSSAAWGPEQAYSGPPVAEVAATGLGAGPSPNVSFELGNPQDPVQMVEDVLTQKSRL